MHMHRDARAPSMPMEGHRVRCMHNPHQTPIAIRMMDMYVETTGKS